MRSKPKTCYVTFDYSLYMKIRHSGVLKLFSCKNLIEKKVHEETREEGGKKNMVLCPSPYFVARGIARRTSQQTSKRK